MTMKNYKKPIIQMKISKNFEKAIILFKDHYYCKKYSCLNKNNNYYFTLKSYKKEKILR